jgi:hypothetical protein
MPKPLLMTGILVKWLQSHFSDPSHIEDKVWLADKIWTPDQDTAILIESVFRWKPELTEKRPGIVVKRSGWRVQRVGIDDRKMVGSKDGTCCQERVEEYTTFLQGSHVVFCLAGESAEVEILATEVYRELIQFGPVARRMFNFLRLVVSDIGEPAILEEATENFVVPIVVSYVAQDIWRICPSSLTI